ncbi:MAG: hypothetical protein ACXAC7_20350 [Candidatus Hodarchaeales archaeon]
MSSENPQIFESFGLVYSEIDKEGAPVIKASSSNYDKDILTVISAV